ncbi:hypothetical protein FOD75_10970 (plasmid) [Limosilactobacillus reuteri]|uniref:Uncharacterized protein n=2 Tax=Limosilactobacillus reuteri TaxID=1598 RepID=A0A517D8D3_LIMRT|nr:hypothetical protein FOD75_10970 [Limosilactobacillus reuteri]
MIDNKMMNLTNVYGKPLTMKNSHSNKIAFMDFNLQGQYLNVFTVDAGSPMKVDAVVKQINEDIFKHYNAVSGLSTERVDRIVGAGQVHKYEFEGNFEKSEDSYSGFDLFLNYLDSQQLGNVVTVMIKIGKRVVVFDGLNMIDDLMIWSSEFVLKDKISVALYPILETTDKFLLKPATKVFKGIVNSFK